MSRPPPGQSWVNLTVSAEIAGVAASALLARDETAAVLELRVPDAALWWPRGYGDQALYDLEVRLTTDDSTVVASTAHRIGFRTVEIDTTADASGTPFTLA